MTPPLSWSPPLFTPEEHRCLEALWPTRPAFWRYAVRASDALTDRGEEACAAALRWLARADQRPYLAPVTCWWCVLYPNHMADLHDTYSNYLPWDPTQPSVSGMRLQAVHSARVLLFAEGVRFLAGRPADQPLPAWAAPD